MKFGILSAEQFILSMIYIVPKFSEMVRNELPASDFLKLEMKPLERGKTDTKSF